MKLMREYVVDVQFVNKFNFKKNCFLGRSTFRNSKLEIVLENPAWNGWKIQQNG